VNWMARTVIALILVSATCWSAVVGAQSTSPGGEVLDGCQDSGFYSKGRFASDLCWECMFPMKIFGITIPVGTRNASKLPTRTAAPLCVCPGRTFGIPSIGITWGMWKPTHTIELTRRPWCSPILFGMELGGDNMRTAQGIALATLQGNPSHVSDDRGKYGSFYNFHWMTFPVGEMINMLTNNLCTKASSDMDYLYFTEFDPTWTSELLALYTHPEIKLFTAIYAHAVCVADAVAATASKPIEQAWWCGGTWGMVYPFAGKGGGSNNPESQFLAAARGLGAMHRRGLAKLSYTDKAICSNAYWFVLPKHQYQFQNMWPWPKRNSAEWIGASSWKWGQWRNSPARFEDRVIVQFSYEECCITAW